MAIQTDITAYTDAAPWRGLGVEVAKNATVKQMLRAAKLDWAVNKVALQGPDGKVVDGHFGLQRSSDGEFLDVCGSRYIPTQNDSAIAFFDEFVRAGDARMSTLGSLMGGRIVWALAELDSGFSVGKDDTVKGYLFLGIPHIQGRSLIARITTKRDVCNNTLSIALRTGKHGIGETFRMNHRNEFNEVQHERAHKVLGIARDQVKSFGQVAAKLGKTKMSAAQQDEFFSKVFGSDVDSRRVRQLQDINENAPGAIVGTAWGALNAVTYYADHVASRTDDKRLTNSWMGRTMRQKEKALSLLTEFANG